MTRLRLIPVLDLQGGVAVRGLAGRRQEYRPLVSPLTQSSQPLDVAEAFRSHFGLSELYLADLDAIAGGRMALPVYDSLRGRGFHLWIDAGIHDADSLIPLHGSAIEGIIVGLETVAGPTVLEEALHQFGERVVFSLDLKNGSPLGDLSGWKQPDAWSLAVQAIALGVRRLLVLDLGRVGMGTGTGTEALCERLAAAYPEVELSAGGGVRGLDDLLRLRRAGACAALVASALHDGLVRPEDLARL